MAQAPILVIEDNPDNQKLITWILEDEGYEITCAGTAEEGLDLLAHQQFGVVLMDISLPGMDGKEATQIIRQTEAWKHLPVIALTAHALQGEVEAIYEAGVDDLIPKPLDEQTLLDKLTEIYSKH